NINKLNKNINETKEKINVTLAELAVLEEQIATQDDDLNQRLRTMYKNGSIGMLSVLLGSKSMSDFLTNMEMVKRIYNSDAQLLADMQVAYDSVIDKKQQLSDLKDSLVAQQETATNAKASLSASEEKLAAQKKAVESDNKALEAQIDELNAEADRLVAEILKLQGNDAYAGGQMCWPSKSSTRITSNFGNRLHPILKVYKLHTGIDIGAAKGTDIIAANSGKVIKAAYNAGGYGYYVMIDHGGGIVTLYAHSSKLLVNVGDIVVRGQTIALVGSTGNSTGPHIHFEVRVNGQYVDPLGYVTAGKY
ncbi:MAG: peptidoglycan DD-metalloendopeptidase family protein, partial [Bacillota bacterium]|nr:peptidoglycan DD-metalloendopeptidase family protein [Bacillota bacterium]